MMKSILSEKVSSKIETLCAQGCTQVNQLLEKAENRKNIVELAEFSHAESQQIIAELAQIMSIYSTDKENTASNCR